jgi:hypothetical protein
MKASAYTFYKGKAALRVDMIPAKEQINENGYAETIPGRVLLELCAAKGKRSYDWENKISFTLSPLEVAQLEVNRLSKQKTEFFHDPNMLSKQQGQITKSFRMDKTETGGYNISITEKNNGELKTVSITLSPAEYYLFRMLIEKGVLKVLAWD